MEVVFIGGFFMGVLIALLCARAVYDKRISREQGRADFYLQKHIIEKDENIELRKRLQNMGCSDYDK